MTIRTSRSVLGTLPASLLLVGVHFATAADFSTEPSWQAPTPIQIRDELQEFAEETNLPPEKQLRLLDAWDSEENVEGDRLDRLAACLAVADERVAALMTTCASVHEGGPLPEFAWLADSSTPKFIRLNMRLYLARWLAQQGYYDEAISWTDGLEPDDVVAPDALLFYRAVAHHQLVKPDEADVVLGQLLEGEENLPARYQKLAALMRKDVAKLEDESLDHIARRMFDIRRRLALGNSGQRVQGVESGVIDSLDKLIKKLEDQRQQQQAQSSSSSGGQQSGTPMQDSQLAELKGPGKVEPRDIGDGSGWGNLPEKDREKALQEIGREFPSHYREVIEEYFRRLAAEDRRDNR